MLLRPHQQSHLWPGSHISHEKEMCNLKLEVGHLHRRLQRRMHVNENKTPSLSQSSSSKGVQSYRQRSKSPPSESFITTSRSVGGKRHHCRTVRTSPPENMGNDAIGKALCLISRSLFSSHIEEAELPYRFT